MSQERHLPAGLDPWSHRSVPTVFIDSDSWHLRVFDAWLICAYSVFDSDSLHLGVFLTSWTRMRSVSTVHTILTVGMLGFMNLG